MAIDELSRRQRRNVRAQHLEVGGVERSELRLGQLFGLGLLGIDLGGRAARGASAMLGHSAAGNEGEWL